MAARRSGGRTVLQCASCGTRHGELSALSTCTRCGGLFDLVLPLPAARLRGARLRAHFDTRAHTVLHGRDAASVSGVWRYRELVLPSVKRGIVSQPEGNTPLVERDAVARFAGVRALTLKLEGLNPTGSFKDRGMTVAITQAGRIGVPAVACASTGNTSASLAAYAALAGIPALVLVPAGKIAGGKLAQTLAYGAHTLAVRGNFDDCLRLARQAADELGVYLVNSVNPFRLSGQQTIVFELLQQLAWDAPDWIALPAGNLGNTSAFGRALVTAHTLGLIARVPRLIAVQARGAAPFARAFARGFAEHHAVHPRTVASAIRIGDPASWDRAVRAIHETNGVAVAVSDRELLEAKHAVDTSGVGCEPASAASVAGVRALVARGVVRARDRVVAVLTGHVLKHPLTGRAAVSSREIAPTVSAVERALREISARG